MREEALKQFFEKAIDASALERDISGSTKSLGPNASAIEIADMTSDFCVDRSMLIQLCDAVLEKKLSPRHLKEIGFALMASDHFLWDDDLMSNVIADWSCQRSTMTSRFRTCRHSEAGYPKKNLIPRNLTRQMWPPIKLSTTSRSELPGLGGIHSARYSQSGLQKLPDPPAVHELERRFARGVVPAGQDLDLVVDAMRRELLDDLA